MKKLTVDELTDILGQDSEGGWEGDNAFQGLQIIAKYINPAEEDIIQAAEHDIIYSVDLEEIIKAGLTKEDAIALRNLGWMEQDGGLACFV